MLEVLMDNDTRCRYFFRIYKNCEEIWAGYLLHDEAWSLIRMAKNANSVSYECNKGNISSKSDEYQSLLSILEISNLY
jgi:hypothetical protein